MQLEEEEGGGGCTSTKVQILTAFIRTKVQILTRLAASDAVGGGGSGQPIQG
jgi:hypothetical protein